MKIALGQFGKLQILIAESSLDCPDCGSHLIETLGNKIRKMVVFEKTNDENLNVLMSFSLGI